MNHRPLAAAGGPAEGPVTVRAAKAPDVHAAVTHQGGTRWTVTVHTDGTDQDSQPWTCPHTAADPVHAPRRCALIVAATAVHGELRRRGLPAEYGDIPGDDPIPEQLHTLARSALRDARRDAPPASPRSSGAAWA